MDRLEPIATPASHYWREFRVRLAPALLFAFALTTVVVLWRTNIAAPTLVGQVETIRSTVCSERPGKLAYLSVSRLDHVRAGQVIAQVVTTDPEVLQSSLAVIRAEIQLLRVNLEPVLGQQRLAASNDRLRLEWMDQRVQLVTARVRLDLAEAELRRAEELFRDKVVSKQILDTALSTRDSLRAEVEERSRLVAQQEQSLQRLGTAETSFGAPSGSSPEDVMRASIKVQEEKLRLTEAQLSPIELRATMDGTITEIHHWSGESILAGEPIVTLAAANSKRIVGYVRQPLSFEPQVGMKVEVRARSFHHDVSEGEILQVGAQLEQISDPLSVLHGSHLAELGLPILVSMPDSQKLLPGELVDLRILECRPFPALRLPALHLR